MTIETREVEQKYEAGPGALPSLEGLPQVWRNTGELNKRAGRDLLRQHLGQRPK